MDIYVHPGINKEGIQRKQIFLLWVGKDITNTSLGVSLNSSNMTVFDRPLVNRPT